jgi:hypothetical protein
MSRSHQVGNYATQCALCGKASELCESHILPAFAYRWLKEDSVTGHMRFSEQPNLRVQDGLKRKLLCRKCDNDIVGIHEKELSENLFRPWLNEHKRIRYGKYLLKFAASVSWRVLTFCIQEGLKGNYSSAQLALIKRAEAQWRGFLLDQNPHPGEFEQHFFIYGNVVAANSPDLPPNINRFARNSIMMDLIGSKNSLYTFAKLGPFFLFGHIQPSNHIWRGSKVHINSGDFPANRIVLPKQLWPVFVEKAKLQSGVTDSISQRQFNKIQESIADNLDKAAKSGSFAAALKDADLFGEEVIIRKR